MTPASASLRSPGCHLDMTAPSIWSEVSSLGSMLPQSKRGSACTGQHVGRQLQATAGAPGEVAEFILIRLFAAKQSSRLRYLGHRTSSWHHADGPTGIFIYFTFPCGVFLFLDSSYKYLQYLPSSRQHHGAALLRTASVSRSSTFDF